MSCYCKFRLSLVGFDRLNQHGLSLSKPTFKNTIFKRGGKDAQIKIDCAALALWVLGAIPADRLCCTSGPG
jgi:penicillin V acylase-like amidase (Ntn superfamily)